jgi:hypothetical protein
MTTLVIFALNALHPTQYASRPRLLVINPLSPASPSTIFLLSSPPLVPQSAITMPPTSLLPPVSHIPPCTTWRPLPICFPHFINPNDRRPSAPLTTLPQLTSPNIAITVPVNALRTTFPCISCSL